MYLGIDLGTSAVKAVVVDGAGSLVATTAVGLTVQNPQSGWSEQHPDQWWAAVQEAVLKLPASLRRAIEGIGLSGQMHGATLLGADDRVLRPAILWNDGRSHEQCKALERAAPDSRIITGNIAMPGFTAPKLLWVRDNEPDIFSQVAMVLLPKDYLRLKMTGTKASDMSDAAGTLWLDTGARDWSDVMLDVCGLDRSSMPQLHEGPDITGVLLQEVANAWGMSAVPVVAGGGDNAAGAIGVGVVEEGDAFLSLGTSGVTFVATDDYRPNVAGAVHTFCHAVSGRWHQMAVHLSAASCVDWAMRQLGIADVSAFFALAEQSAPGHSPEIFLPFLSGERTPLNDPFIRAGWLQCDASTAPANLAAAVLEGVAFVFADGIASLRTAGSPMKRAIMIGGGSRSRHWGQIIAGVTDTALVFVEGGDSGPAMGAARLAHAGVGNADIAAVCSKLPEKFTIEPDRTIADRLAPKLKTYRRAVSALSSTEENV